MTNKLRLETKASKGATIKKAILILSALATLSWGQFVWADETYTYTGPNFTGYFGNYDAAMSVTGSITTSAPIPPNLTDYNIGGLVTSWSFTDGVNTLQAPGSVLIAVVNTNDTGDIVGGQIGAYTLPWRTQVGDIQDLITIRYDPALIQGIEDLECTEDDGNGTCTNNTSLGHGEVLAVGTWERTGDAVLYSVGGSVSGLTGTGLALQNNGADTLAVAAAATDFTFATELPDLATYAVTVSTQPSGQTCEVTNGSGTIAAADVTNVAVTCVTDIVPTYSVGGTVSGLTGTGLTLQNNGADTLAVAADGPFTFLTELTETSSYAVTVSTQPTGQTCEVTNGSGTIADEDVTDVGVACVDDVVPPIDPPAPAVPVPTLSQWALIMLSMLLGLMVFSNRRRLF